MLYQLSYLAPWEPCSGTNRKPSISRDLDGSGGLEPSLVLPERPSALRRACARSQPPFRHGFGATRGRRELSASRHLAPAESRVPASAEASSGQAEPVVLS